MRVLTFAACVVLAAGAAAAQPISGRDAQGALFDTRGTTVQVSGALSATDQAIIRETIKLLGEQMRGPIRFYAAIAYSPDEGILTDALQSALNYHSPAAADAAAAAACNAVRGAGTAPCQIAARVLPRGYEPRALTLSHDATEDFRRSYRRKSGSKAFAASEATGAWGVGGSPAEAVSACNAGARGAGDCRVVVQD